MRTGLELRHLRVLVAVVDAGTHSGAARALGSAQSTVSETLGALERTLGVEVFRKSKGVALTPAGEVLLAYARRISALTGELASALVETSRAVRATIVVSAVESIGAYVLPSRLAVLRERWPAVRVEVETGNCAEIRQRVASGDSDLGLVLEPEDAPEPGELLARARLLLLQAPMRAAAICPVSAQDLRGCVVHMCDAGGSYHQALRQLFEAAGVPAPRTQAMGTIEGVKRGILAGGPAVGLLPEHAVEAELRDGVLVELRLEAALRGVALRAVLAPGQGRSPVIDALVDALRGSPGRGLRLTASPQAADEPLTAKVSGALQRTAAATVGLAVGSRPKAPAIR
jgi:DNA-binding transcriptional LysR family regulator